MYVNANFASTCHKEYSQLRDSVLSRTGFIITYCNSLSLWLCGCGRLVESLIIEFNCPVIWSSKLQIVIALSTTEAEYIVLSMATRQLLPLCRIMAELSQDGPIAITLCQKQPMSTFTNSFNSTQGSPSLAASLIYDYSAAWIIWAENDHHKPRTKHISLKWHHLFRDQTQQGEIKVQKIESQKNWADILTKPLLRIAHHRLTSAILRW